MTGDLTSPKSRTRQSRPAGREQIDARREQVVAEAAALFEQRGYQSTSVADIAHACDMAKASIYHYFASKEEILFWIHEEFIDLLIQRHVRRLETHMSAEQSVLELMGDILELMDTHRGHVRAFFENHSEVSAERQASIRAKRRRYTTMVQDVLQEGIASGEFRPIDVRLGALAIFGMCNWTYKWYRRGGELRSREIAYTFWDFAMRGFAAGAPPLADPHPAADAPVHAPPGGSRG